MSEFSSPRSDYRILRKVLQITLGSKIEHVPEEYDLILRLFQKAGGSWYRIFVTGKVEDLVLLKKIIKYLFKKKHLTRKYTWGNHEKDEKKRDI